MYKTFIETRFSAAHRLVGYQGQCGRIHGHTWKVRVEVVSETVNDIGISIDFKELKQLTKHVVDRLDHENINEVPPFDSQNPTAENLAQYIYREVQKELPNDVRLGEITVWESENHAVIYSE